MKKALVFLSCILLAGCISTPKPIQKISTVNIQTMQAVRQDIKMNNDKLFNELNHWIDLSYGLMLQNDEDAMKDANGKVDLNAYKAKLDDYTNRIAAVKGKYSKDHSDIDAAFEDKLTKALILQSLIDQYEQSTGVQPETISALITELGTTAGEAFQMYKTYEESKPAKEPSLSDRLNTVAQGKLEELVSKIEKGEIGNGQIIDKIKANSKVKTNIKETK